MLTKNDLTAIGNLFDKKFDEKLDQRLVPIETELKKINTKIVGIYGELDGVKQQLIGVDGRIGSLETKVTSLETKITSLDSKLEEFREETQQNFNTVFNGLTNLGETIDKNLEPRIKHLENKVFSQSFPLAK